MPNIDVLVAGELNPDLILADPNLEPRFGQQEILVQDMQITAGSSSVIYACGAARLGLKVAFIGVIGEDSFGSFMLDALQERGVDTSAVIVDSQRTTGLTVILNRVTDRAILTYPGAINALHAEQVKDDLLRQSRHLHVASYFLQTALQPGLPDLFHRARALGLTTSLDSNWDPTGKWSGFDALLRLTDIFFPNETEIQSLTGRMDIDEAARVLAEKCNILAVKLGAKGALAYHGDEICRAPALSVQVADTVGAGDSFDAGFTYGFLQDWCLDRCLRLGIACGSLSTRAHGGTTAQPTLEEALQYANRIAPCSP